jgi:hypothetical protein
MPSPRDIEQAIARVTDRDTFLRDLLADTLDWPIPDRVEEIEDLAYGWKDEDLRAQNLGRDLLDGQVWQLNLKTNQPWGIFLVEFGKERVYRTVLRRVLRGLVPSRRRDAGLPAWKHENLLFLCATKNYRNLTFAHFRGDKAQTARLATFGWIAGDRHVRTVCEHNLPHLAWPDAADPAAWLTEWARAFDVEAVTKRFFDAYREVFESVERAVKGVRGEEPKRLYVQRLFNRLMFLYFIQRKGWLSFGGDRNYLRALFNAAEAGDEDFLNDRLYWTFFYGLNTAGENYEQHKRPELEAKRGEVPFLNGGLFDLEDDFDKHEAVRILSHFPKCLPRE